MFQGPERCDIVHLYFSSSRQWCLCIYFNSMFWLVLPSFIIEYTISLCIFLYYVFRWTFKFVCSLLTLPCLRKWYHFVTAHAICNILLSYFVFILVLHKFCHAICASVIHFTKNDAQPIKRALLTLVKDCLHF